MPRMPLVNGVAEIVKDMLSHYSEKKDIYNLSLPTILSTFCGTKRKYDFLKHFRE